MAKVIVECKDCKSFCEAGNLPDEDWVQPRNKLPLIGKLTKHHETSSVYPAFRCRNLRARVEFEKIPRAGERWQFDVLLAGNIAQFSPVQPIKTK